MFHYIKGRLTHSALGVAVVEAGGVGYRMTVSENTYRALPPARTEAEEAPAVTLYTYLAVREDDVELFGFSGERELAAFRMLLTVSGVGPKAAMNILSVLTPDRFTAAVCAEDRKALSKAPGIGPKTAARIILDLRDRLLKELPESGDLSSVLAGGPAAEAAPRGRLDEAQEALLALGYTRAEAQNALRNLDPELPLEDLVREGLRRMMGP